jgi:succinoglycan biosynthesis transport protein ExoP
MLDVQKTRQTVERQIPVDRDVWSHQGPSPADLVDSILGMLRRQLGLTATVTLIGVALGILYLATAPAIYMANAQLMLDARKVQLFPQQGMFGDPPVDSAAVENQIQAIRSDKVSLAVVKNIGLAQDPEFAGSGSLVRPLLELLPASVRPALPAWAAKRLVAPSDLQKERVALSTLQRNLKVDRVGASLIIDISYRSFNPGRAAEIANAVGDGYLVDQLEAKYQLNQRASNWLQDRMRELHEQGAAAERAVADFKAENNIVTTNGRPLSDEDLNQLNSQVGAARAQTSEARARLDRIEAIIRSDNADAAMSGAVSDSLNNPIITKLRTDYLQNVNREAELSAKYGANHLAAVNLRQQIRALKGSILDELRRIAESYKSDYEIARQRRDALEKSLAQAAQQSQSGNRTSGKLHELEVSAQTYRALHDNFLQRYTESVQQQSFPIAEARLVRPATAPLDKSSPKPLIVMALASLGGLGIGLALGLLRELTDRVFRTAGQIENALQTDCISIIPSLNVTGRGPGARGLVAYRGDEPARIVSRTQSPMWNVIDSPFSRFAEAIRAIKLASDLGGVVKPNKIIGITSSLPNEGKSTVAAALGLLTAQAGCRVILVDCDLRNPSLTAALAPSAEAGFLDVVSGRKSLGEVVWVEPTTKLAFLPSVVPGRFLNSSEILSGDATKGLFESLRRSYDYVIVDLSPLAPVVDVRATTQFVDSFLFVIEWGRTRIGVVNHALSQARNIHQNLLGVVLNKASIRELSRYERQTREYYDNKHYARYGYSE